RIACGFDNLNRALGGGFVRGQVILLAGEPGIGKSTLALELCGQFAKAGEMCLYVSGEESLHQLSLRARRLDCALSGIIATSNTSLEEVIKLIELKKPALVLVDSIQTLYSESLESPPGSVSQVRQCAFKLTKVAKEIGVITILIGQVNKEGMIAGPKVLEHVVDTVLYFEGERFGFQRVIKVAKNRFGPSGEIAVFKMTERGLEEVLDPSAFFLQERTSATGSVVFSHIEGSRPFLIEVQALTVKALYNSPQRRAQGIDVNRLALILAVLEKEVKLFTRDIDVFVNVVGGIELSEPAADLAVAVSVASSLKSIPIGDIVVFGELGLSGEVRSVYLPEERLKEASRYGFSKAIVPRGVEVDFPGEVYRVGSITQALQACGLIL
ncbi:MAG: DNA repair protein RadA, partial [Aquificaceae bacterium]|nr:DNA repair protein RadA [Aquificaceae bacterium]MDW8237046.1 DNA repair protein RadA [Aquificaceae bacterium]